MVPRLDGVTHVVVVVDPVVCGQMTRVNLVPFLLLGLRTPGPRVVRAIAGGVITVSSYR